MYVNTREVNEVIPEIRVIFNTRTYVYYRLSSVNYYTQ